MDDTTIKKTAPLIFSQLNKMSPQWAIQGIYSLETLNQAHPGVAPFLLSICGEAVPSRITRMNRQSSGAAVYLLEYHDECRKVLKVLPTNNPYDKNRQLEMACTLVASDNFVSPKGVRLDKYFILLPYIGRGECHPATNQPILNSKKSFKNVVKRLSLLHGALIMPNHMASNSLEKVCQGKMEAFIQKNDFLNKIFKQIERAYQNSSLGSSNTRSVFIHANLTPQNIVEDFSEAYLIDWGHQPGKGNTYFDLGAIFAMYALDDQTKIKLIRENYPSTVFNKLPEEDDVLLKELSLFSAIYWFKIAVETIMKFDMKFEQYDKLNKFYDNAFYVDSVFSKEVDVMTPEGEQILAKTAFYETQKRIAQVGELEQVPSESNHVKINI